MVTNKIKRLDRTPNTDDRPFDQYVLTFEFEHGDADARTQYSITTPTGITETQLIEYLEAFLDLASLVADARCGSSSLPSKEPTPVHGIHMPLERDVMCTACDMYATMECTNIWYFDGYGNRWNVEMVVAN